MCTCIIKFPFFQCWLNGISQNVAVEFGMDTSKYFNSKYVSSVTEMSMFVLFRADQHLMMITAHRENIYDRIYTCSACPSLSISWSIVLRLLRYRNAIFFAFNAILSMLIYYEGDR